MPEPAPLAPGARVQIRANADGQPWRQGTVREAFGAFWAVVPEGGGRALLFRGEELTLIEEEEADGR